MSLVEKANISKVIPDDSPAKMRRLRIILPLNSIFIQANIKTQVHSKVSYLNEDEQVPSPEKKEELPVMQYDELINQLHDILFYNPSIKPKPPIEEEQEDTNSSPDVLDSLPIKRKLETIVLIPKIFTFGDDLPRNINYSEYSENFSAYKVDVLSLVKYLQKHSDEAVSIDRLRDILSLVGSTYGEEEIAGIKKSAAKERLRKKRIEELKDKQEEERQKDAELKLQKTMNILINRNVAHSTKMSSAKKEIEEKEFQTTKFIKEKHLPEKEESKGPEIQFVSKDHSTVHGINRFVKGLVKNDIIGNAMNMIDMLYPSEGKNDNLNLINKSAQNTHPLLSKELSAKNINNQESANISKWDTDRAKILGDSTSGINSAHKSPLLVHPGIEENQVESKDKPKDNIQIKQKEKGKQTHETKKQENNKYQHQTKPSSEIKPIIQNVKASSKNESELDSKSSQLIESNRISELKSSEQSNESETKKPEIETKSPSNISNRNSVQKANHVSPKDQTLANKRKSDEIGKKSSKHKQSPNSINTNESKKAQSKKVESKKGSKKGSKAPIDQEAIRNQLEEEASALKVEQLIPSDHPEIVDPQESQENAAPDSIDNERKVPTDKPSIIDLDSQPLENIEEKPLNDDKTYIQEEPYYETIPEYDEPIKASKTIKEVVSPTKKLDMPEIQNFPKQIAVSPIRNESRVSNVSNASNHPSEITVQQPSALQGKSLEEQERERISEQIKKRMLFNGIL